MAGLPLDPMLVGGSPPGVQPGGSRARGKAMTIGAVCKALTQEFPDISISKIRYLEDQKLLTPRRTPGGYRLYSSGDVQRLRTILRLQRDEFLPLRVIRQELATGAGREEEEEDGALPVAQTGADAAEAEKRRRRRSSVSVRETGALYSLDDVVEDTRADPRLVAELEEYGVIRGERRLGITYYDETEREIVRAVTELARYGVGGRNLRAFRTSADREAALLQQILAPALRSRNIERRKEAIDALENLAAVTTHLKHLLLIRDLRKIAGT
jgi:DNA-binding transcriptional MerR regulator